MRLSGTLLAISAISTMLACSGTSTDDVGTPNEEVGRAEEALSCAGAAWGRGMRAKCCSCTATGGDVNMYWGYTGHPKIVLYTHGTSGSYAGWYNKATKDTFIGEMNNRGYGFVALDSSNRSAKQWNTSESSSNVDVQNWVTALNQLGLASAGKKFYFVGHSNGGTFAPLHALYSPLANKRAVSPNHGTGTATVIRNGGYGYPTIWLGDVRDTQVRYSTQQTRRDQLAARGIPAAIYDYSGWGATNAHEFSCDPATVSTFFNTYAP